MVRVKVRGLGMYKRVLIAIEEKTGWTLCINKISVYEASLSLNRHVMNSNMFGV